VRQTKTKINAIILAGGRSLRMSKDKAHLLLNGKPMVEIIIEKFKRIFSELIIVTNASLLSSFAFLTKKYKLKVVKDLVPQKGPLGGIYTGLNTSSSFYNFVVACDMPLPNSKLLRYMKKIIDGYDAVIPYRDKFPEPLFALYSKECLEPIRKRLFDRDLKVTSFFTDIKIRSLTQKEIDKFDRGYLSFFNVNNLKDYRFLLKLISKKKN
jgi:molybdopterin-guanine dinucleotide biosynthesis protein A